VRRCLVLEPYLWQTQTLTERAQMQSLTQANQMILARIVEALLEVLQMGQRVYVFGNSASAALASHVAGDLEKFSAVQLSAGTVPPGGQRLRIRQYRVAAAIARCHISGVSTLERAHGCGLVPGVEDATAFHYCYQCHHP
jgi:poly(3-hydroxybutyrate) depolymerase